MYIGIDLGGTNIGIGIVDKENNLIFKDSIPTRRERGYTEIIRDMVKLINKVIANENINIHTEGTVSLLSTSSDKLTVYYEDEEITPKTTDIASLLTYQIIPHNENN